MKNKQESIVKKAMKGNVDAYGILIEENKEYLYKMAFLYTKNEDKALDVVQDTVLKGFTGISKLKKPEWFRTWITRILINTEKETYCKVIPFASPEELENCPDQHKQMIEERIDLYDAIDHLPEKYQTVVILKYFTGMQLNEIASTMEIPEGSVSAYLTRAKMELRKYLKEDYSYGS